MITWRSDRLYEAIIKRLNYTLPPYSGRGIVMDCIVETFPFEDVIATQGKGWHTDNDLGGTQWTALLIVRDDGFAVQDKTGISISGAGNFIIFDHTKLHRCVPLDGKTKGKWWAAINNIYFDQPDKEMVEEYFSEFA